MEMVPCGVGSAMSCALAATAPVTTAASPIERAIRAEMNLREMLFTVSSFLSSASHQGRTAHAGPIPIVPPIAPDRLNRT